MGLRTTILCVLTVALAAARASGACATETPEFRIVHQPGIVYLQELLMEDRKLVEKHAAAQGLADVKVSWSVINSGGTITDALLSGSIDIATTGLSNMLLLWSKSNGAVKSIAGVAGLPQLLVTRNTNINSIKDFGPGDRIAVPTVRVSMQAMILGMALEQAYGPGNHNKLDSLQVQLGHPDAVTAILNPVHEINSHFSIAPYYEMELKAPNVRAVVSSIDVLGGPATITNVWATQKFVDDNPIKVRAFIAALDEASELVTKDPMGAAATYLAMTKEKISVEELAALIKEPGAIFSATPQRSMVYADFMHRIGLIQKKPATWKEYFFPAIHDRPGS
jgi:NitT/TauT family transport system substrate-binding protein